MTIEKSLTPSERVSYRLLLTAVVTGTTIVFIPLVIVLKIVEGFYVSGRIFADCIRQAWAKPIR